MAVGVTFQRNRENAVSLAGILSYLTAMKGCALLLGCCALLFLPADALAVRCAPPGTSGVDQYIESIPGSSCNQTSSGPSGPTGGGGNGGSAALPPGTGGQLSAQGPAGRAVANLVASSGTASSGSQVRSGAGGQGAASGSAGGQSASANGRNPVSALLHPIVAGSRSGGSGVLLPVFLAVVLALALALTALTIVRRRRLSS
jgi:hypothetical protein